MLILAFDTATDLATSALVVDDETLRETGRLVWEHRGERLLAVGSQGVEYALVAHWRAAGLLEQPKAAFCAPPAERIACVSGSCSPVTAGQIAFAEQDLDCLGRLNHADDPG